MFALWKVLLQADTVKERVLRALIPARTNVFPYNWPLVPGECPCDLHFCNYLRERGVSGRTVFHFGTGGHHLVGLRNMSDGLENEVLGITLSPREHARYVKLVAHDPSLGEDYKVLFADIYNLGARLLPYFDVVTLFHLCEFTPAADRPRRRDDVGLVDLFCSKLRPSGRLLFYKGSYGHARTRQIIDERVRDGTLAFEEQYESLLVYRRQDLPEEGK